MNNINEYEDLDSLLGDMIDLGLAKDKVFIEVMENKHSVRYDRSKNPYPKYDVIFPKFNKTSRIPTESDIIECIRNKEYIFVDKTDEFERDFNKRYDIPSEKLKFQRLANQFLNAGLAFFLKTLTGSSTYTEVKWIVSEKVLMEVNNKNQLGKKRI